MRRDNLRFVPAMVVDQLRSIVGSLSLSVTLVFVFACQSALADDQAVVRTFLADLSKQAAASSKAEQFVIQGKNGWMFFVPELRGLSVGPFWGEAAARVSRSMKPAYADPLPAIVDFHNQLRQAGIELIVMPVPAKAAVYPERISSTIELRDNQSTLRLDASHHEFYQVLKKQGVTVIDLVPLFLEHREAAGGPLYCKTDSHWSARGIELAADAVFRVIQEREWVKDLAKRELLAEIRTFELAGDLARMLNDKEPQTEEMQFTRIGVGKELIPLPTARESPVLLIGDSHTLVFHDLELFASGGGLPDHIAKRMGIAVDLIGVRGSGATTARIELLRRKDNLKGKKLVIWCFSVREFTESTTGWRKIPVIR